MDNARKEILRYVDKSDILCAEIRHEKFTWGEKLEPQHYSMKIGDNVTEFLKQLDFNYDDGYGLQELFGTVWLKDGTWLERREYDGSEWWVHQVMPSIPDYLKMGEVNANTVHE
jgi:hypothetical protein